MTFTMPDGLAPEVYPLAWLVGRWRGGGLVSYPNIPEAFVTQEIFVERDGGQYLRWTGTLWLGTESSPGHEPDATVWATESGYWRIPPDRPADLAADRFPVELLLIDPAGHLTLYAGITGNGRIDLASDLIARTPDAVEVAAATRLYGLVQGELM